MDIDKLKYLGGTNLISQLEEVFENIMQTYLHVIQYFVEKCVLVFFQNIGLITFHIKTEDAYRISEVFPKYTYALHLGKGVE